MLSGTQLTAGDKDGTVVVKVEVPTDANHQKLTATITVTILPKPKQTINASPLTVTYGDTGKKVAATVTGNKEGMKCGDLSYAVSEGYEEYIDVNESTGELTTKKAGTTYVTVYAAEDDNYAASYKDVKVTVAPADNPARIATTAAVDAGSATNSIDLKGNVTLPEGMSARYDDSDIEYDIVGDDKGCTLEAPR